MIYLLLEYVSGYDCTTLCGRLVCYKKITKCRLWFRKVNECLDICNQESLILGKEVNVIYPKEELID